MVFNLSERNSIASQFLFELRHENLQIDRARFRRNVERLGHILAYEISKELEYESVLVKTPVASASANKLRQMPLLVTIMRAGLPLLRGFLDMFDQSDCGFIGAYREEGTDDLRIKLDYAAIPPLSGKDLILVDPMLATGRSVVRTLETILRKQKAASVHIASVIAAPEGIRFVEDYVQNLPCPARIWTGAVDSGLNDKFYIVPGLGDAGDLSFGVK